VCNTPDYYIQKSFITLGCSDVGGPHSSSFIGYQQVIERLVSAHHNPSDYLLCQEAAALVNRPLCILLGWNSPNSLQTSLSQLF